MGNQLVNSMVRGFGFTMGRKAADAVTRPSAKSVQPSYSKKQLELIATYEGILKDVRETDRVVEQSFKNGSITEAEYKILKAQVNDQINEGLTEIEKIKSVQPSSGSFWKWFFILLFGVPFLIGLLKGLFS